jgi:hypothetical protein
MKYLEKLDLLNTVEFRDAENQTPYWRNIEDDSRLIFTTWKYEVFDETFVISQYEKDGAYEWEWAGFKGAAPTLRDARSAARNAIRSSVIRAARTRYYQLLKEKGTN